MNASATVGTALPDLPLTAPDGTVVKPSDFAGRKAVLFFYPKDDTPGCTVENQDFQACPARLPRPELPCWGSARTRPPGMQNSSPSTA